MEIDEDMTPSGHAAKPMVLVPTTPEPQVETPLTPVELNQVSNTAEEVSNTITKSVLVCYTSDLGYLVCNNMLTGITED